MKEADGYWHKQGSAPPKKDNFAKLKVVRTTFLCFCETKETCEINKRKHIQHTRPLCYFAVFQSPPPLPLLIIFRGASVFCGVLLHPMRVTPASASGTLLLGSQL